METKIKRCRIIAKAVFAMAMFVLLVYISTGRALAQTPATWYVATNGSDNAACGSDASPCATVQYALNNKINAGETIKIKPGTYASASQGKIIANNLVKHQGITIEAADMSAKPSIIGTDAVKTAIQIGGTNGRVNNVTIRGINIRASTSGYTSWGPVIDLYGYGATVEDCELSYGGTGIAIRDYSITIKNNYIHNMGVWGSGIDAMGIGITTSDDIPSIYPSGWNEQILIEGNTIEYCEGDAFQDGAQYDLNGYIYFKNNIMRYFGEQPLDFKMTEYIKFEGNDLSYGNQRTPDSTKNGYCQFHGNNNGGALAETSHVEIWNNVFHDDTYCAIDNSATTGLSTDWKIYNNIFYNLLTNPLYESGAVSLINVLNATVYHNTFYNIRETSGTARRVTCIQAGMNGNNIKNNLLLNCGDDVVNDRGAISSIGLTGVPSYNYIYSTNRGDSTCAGSCTAGSNAITSADPGFIDAAKFDFRLKSDSVLINKGTNVGIAADYAGNTRDAQPDIGAYEYGGATSNPADINQDGSVNIKDIQTCVKVITGVITDPATKAKTDVNGDGSVNIKDIQEIVKTIVETK